MKTIDKHIVDSLIDHSEYMSVAEINKIHQYLKDKWGDWDNIKEEKEDGTTR